MTFGAVSAIAKLDHPGKIYYGQSEAVECHAVLSYTARPKKYETPQELFGPLKVTVVFEGRVKTKIVIQRGSGTNRSTSVYRSTVTLFSQSMPLFNDSFKCEPSGTATIPFKFYFPVNDTAPPSDDWEQTPIFPATNGPLPPSFEFSTSGGSYFRTYVEYRVGLVASMPGIHVDMHTQDWKSQPTIRYERPHSLSPSQRQLRMRGEGVRLQNEILLPEEERPHGFRQSAKALFTQNRLPIVIYSWTATTLQELHSRQPLIFDVTVSEDQRTLCEPPEVQLKHIEVRLKSHLEVRSAKRLFSTPQKNADAWAFQLLAKPVDRKPFSKANEWTKRFITAPLPDMVSTFATYNVALDWRISITLPFEINGKVLDKKVKNTIIMSPPLMQSLTANQAESSAAAGAFAGPGEGSSSAAQEPALPLYSQALTDPVVPAPQYCEAPTERDSSELMAAENSVRPKVEMEA